MPIYKRCQRCGNRISSGTACECSGRQHYEHSRTRIDVKERQFYSSALWQKARQEAINRCNGIDIYSYWIQGIISVGQTVHHIEPVKESFDKRLDNSNLIYLTESNHQMIHIKMKQDYSGTVKMLQDLVRKHVTSMRGI